MSYPICVFAALADENCCSLQGLELGCRGDVTKCPILLERGVALENFWQEMELNVSDVKKKDSVG